MEFQSTSFILFLSILWFLIYWVFGGVFFALLTLLRLGRIRKLRFSCLFTLLAVACGYGAARWGIVLAGKQIQECLNDATNRVETISAVFGCGFVSVFGGFLFGAAILIMGGLLFMMISKTKTRPWIILEQEDQPEEKKDKKDQETSSKFFHDVNEKH